MASGHTNRIVEAGELMLLNSGAYDQAYVAGLFRAKADLDFDALTKRYLATITVGRADFDPPELPPVAFGEDPRSSDPIQRGYIAWLEGEGLVERIPTAEVRLDGSFTIHDKPTASVWVEPLPPEGEPAPGFGNR